MEKQIPILDLVRQYTWMKDAIDRSIAECLKHQTWILGPEVGLLEKKLSTFLDSPYCIGCSSGTEALVLALRAIAIEDLDQEFFEVTDEVVTTPLTFTATGDSILRAGATPVFVDIDPRTQNINLEQVERYLELSSNVRAVMPVHLYGHPVDAGTLLRMKEKYGFRIIEDVAQAFGASSNGKMCGTYADFGAFSFFPSKNLGGFGDGGLVTSNDESLAELCRILTKHGGKDKYNVDHIGYNARIDTLQAAVLLAKLEYITDLNNRRRKIAAAYTSAFKTLAGITVPDHMTPGHVFHQYTVRIHGGERNDFMNFLKDRGIGSMIYYPVPLPRMNVFEGRCKEPFGTLEASNACSEVLSLPIEPLLTDEEIARVIEVVKEYFF